MAPSVLELGPGPHLLSEVVGVRVEAHQLHVHGQPVGVPDAVALLPRGNVHRLGAKPEPHGRAGGRFAEVEAHLDLDRGGVRTGEQVQLQHQVAPAGQPPGQALGNFERRLARGPAEEVPVRALREPGLHARPAGLGVEGVEMADGPGRIHQHDRVVDHLVVAGPELHRPDEPVTLGGDRNHEAPEDVPAGFRNDVGLGHGHDQVGFAHLPTGCEPRGRRQRRRVAFGRAALGPAPQRLDRVLGQPAFAHERLGPRIRQPGRHGPRPGFGRDQPGTLPRSGVSLQAEGTDASFAVAGDAVLEEDRSDVPGEGDGLLDGRQGGRDRNRSEK